MWGVQDLPTRVTGPSGKERLEAAVCLVRLHSLTHAVLPWELLATTSHAFWRRIESDFLSQSQAFLGQGHGLSALPSARFPKHNGE